MTATTTQNLTNLNMTTLVSMVNELGGEATVKTFSQRSKAVQRLTKLATAKNIDLDVYFNADGTKREVKAPTVKAPKVAKEKVAKEPKVTIRSVAEALLVKVVAEEDGKAVGLSYEDVLATVKEQFPTAKTTVGCLRWYAVRLREASVTVPNRPRAVKAVAPTVEVPAEVPAVETAIEVPAETAAAV